MSWTAACLLMVVATACPAAADGAEPQEAVNRFLREAYPFERAVDREYAIRGQVKDVTDELGIERVSSSERVFSFPVKAGAPIFHALVAVNAQGSVRLLNDRESINGLFDAVPTDLAPHEAAQLLVDTFLRVISFNGYRNNGYPLGINVVREASDIPGFADDSLAGVIQPPQLVPNGEGYCFTAFSWTKAGGAVLRHKVFFTDNRISDYQIETLATWVGAHGPAH